MTEQEAAADNKTITVTAAQAEQLQAAFTLAKAVASPTRLTIIGTLAARVTQASRDPMTVAELANMIGAPLTAIKRDLRQLIDAEIVRVDEWAPAWRGEPQPQVVSFNPEYLRAMPPLITALHQLHAQIEPPEQGEKLDERGQTLSRFMRNGQVVALPVQLKRQMYIYEEAAKAFQPDRQYSEREVDAILKEIWPADHCTLRRALVDNHMLDRANGIYWKNVAGADGTSQTSL